MHIGMKKGDNVIPLSPIQLVEATGFEPAAFWSRTKRATKLRYASNMEPKRGLGPLTYALRVRRSTD